MRWQDESACKYEPIEKFFPKKSSTTGAYEPGREMCESCPVALWCRLSSIGESDGMFANTTPKQRQVFRASWKVGDPFGMLASEGYRVAARAFARGEDPREVAREWLGPKVGEAWMDWYAVALPEEEYREWVRYINAA